MKKTIKKDESKRHSNDVYHGVTARFTKLIRESNPVLNQYISFRFAIQTVNFAYEDMTYPRCEILYVIGNFEAIKVKCTATGVHRVSNHALRYCNMILTSLISLSYIVRDDGYRLTPSGVEVFNKVSIALKAHYMIELPEPVILTIKKNKKAYRARLKASR